MIDDDMHRAEKRALICGVTVAAVVLGSMGLAASRNSIDIASETAVPPALKVPDGNVAVAGYHAVGSQQYVCLPKESAFAWTLFGPQATLFDAHGDEALTHFLSSNPRDDGKPAPSWQDVRDASVAWGKMIASSNDRAFVAPNAIPWLLLEVAGSQPGPNGGNAMTQMTYVQRVATTGGVASSSTCAAATDVGKKALVPYEANYIFYAAHH